MSVEPIKIPLTRDSDTERELRGYLRNKIRAIREGLTDIHQNRLVKWRKTYESQPAEAHRSFPFENASNIVIPVVAIHVDTLLARVMAAVLKTRPAWVVKVLGEHPGLEDSRSIIEAFMEYVAYEPTELDLFPIYEQFFGSTIKNGTGILKTPYVSRTEDVVLGSTGEGLKFQSKTIYEGPKPQNVAFQDFGISPRDKKIEDSSFYYHVVHLSREQLEERKHLGVYDKTSVDRILMQPDRTSPSTIDQQSQSDSGAKVVGSYGWAEWDIYECHVKYLWHGHYTRCILWYHEFSNTIARAFFNYYPDCIFIAGRLFYRDDQFHGYGFAEMLAPFQEEISQIHNQRRDNQTIANTKAWRVAPDSKLLQGYKIYPSAMLPAEEGEIEPLSMGEISPMSIDEEKLSLDLAERRSGVSPPMQGMGAGANTKRGVYSAMGTLSLLQEGNTRTDMNVGDMRYAHTKLGRLLATMYGSFGTGDRAELFGAKGQLLDSALQQFVSRKLGLPVSSSTASVNREVEKQNDLMLTNITKQHYQTITQMMQSIGNQMLPDEIKKYLSESMEAANAMMRMVMRHFGYDEVDRLIPDVPKAPQAVAGGLSPGGSPALQPHPSGGPTGAGPSADDPGVSLPQGVPSGHPLSQMPGAGGRPQ